MTALGRYVCLRALTRTHLCLNKWHPMRWLARFLFALGQVFFENFSTLPAIEGFSASAAATVGVQRARLRWSFVDSREHPAEATRACQFFETVGSENEG